MGINDSSLKRVGLVFDELIRIEPTGSSWLPAVLASAQREGAPPISTGLHERLKSAGPITDIWYKHSKMKDPPPILHAAERAFDAPHSLLLYLLDKATPPKSRQRWGSAEARHWRELLFEGSPTERENARGEAERLLATGRRTGSWFVLEGPSYPDVTIETPNLLILIEGKFTESGPTTTTTWMRGRHQILRFIDAAWDARGARSVVAMFIVEDDSAPKWRQAVQSSLSHKALTTSLPHRDERTRAEMADALIGIATWRSIQTTCGLRVALPEAESTRPTRQP